MTELMGLGFDPLTEAETVRHVLEASSAGRGGFLCTINLDILRQCTRDAGLHDLIGGADLKVADGMPLIWVSRLIGAPLPERVAGSSAIWTLSAGAAEAGRTIFLLGGDPGIADEAATVLAGRYPGLDVVGTYCPPMGFEGDAAELARIEQALVAARPDIVFVGLGFPKQERLIARLRPLLPDGWFVNCGISLSFVAGHVPRAPRLVQRLGLEWAFRLVQEPRRLARRYLVDGPPFFAAFLGWAVRQRLAGSATR